MSRSPVVLWPGVTWNHVGRIVWLYPLDMLAASGQKRDGRMVTVIELSGLVCEVLLKLQQERPDIWHEPFTLAVDVS
jgi:hypothetical protein